jgi:hypothetical protein
MKNMLRAVACIAGASAMYATVSASKAYAQSGSRLCGWQTSSVKTKVGDKVLKDVHVAIVYEARSAELLYTMKCSKAIESIKKKLPKSITVDVSLPAEGGDDKKRLSNTGSTTPKTQKMTLMLKWKKVEKATCESVGAKFDGQGVPKDICDKMKANNAYQWMKKSSTEKATVKKVK